MKTKYLKMIVLILCIACLDACKKEDDGLTKITKEGLNTFSCKIMASIFIPNQDLFGPKPIIVYVNTTNGVSELYLSANSSRSIIKNMTFHINNFRGVGTYPLSLPTFRYYINAGNYSIAVVPNGYAVVNLKVPSPSERFIKDGHLEIIRYDSGIVAGLFEYSFLDGNNEMKITKGRFDLRL